MSNRAKPLAILAAAVLAVAGVAPVAVGRWQAYRFRVAPTDVTPRPLEPVGWASGSATRRHEMAAHMTADRQLIGLFRAELVERLGPPTAEREPGVLEWNLGERQDPTGLMWNYDEYLWAALDEVGACRSAGVCGRD